MTTNLVEQYKELKLQYQVPHLINDNKRVLFVLESPHVDELIHKSPVSGSSGKSMTKTLFPYQNQALGIKLKSEPEHIIGIMNICSVPMQEAAYNDKKVIELYNSNNESVGANSFFNVLENIREKPKTNYNNIETNELQNAILDDFREEMRKLENQPLLIIPCGKTASEFFSMAGVTSTNWTILSGIPHPSFNSWHRNTNKSLIHSMRLKINEIYWELRNIDSVPLLPIEVFHSLIDEQNINLNQLALDLNEDDYYLVKLYEGHEKITNELAEKLDNFFAIPKEFWLTK